jgi:TRAP-type mannitol/chloroaromatic compound transport system substrate-binding protein
MAMGLAAHVKFVLGLGLAPAGSAVALSVNRRVWDSLDAASQAILAAAAAEEFRLTLAEARANEAILRRALRETHGISPAPFPEDVLGALATVADAVVAHAAGHDALSARVNASYMAFQQAAGGREFTSPGFFTS